jgi:hypothetical protein
MLDAELDDGVLVIQGRGRAGRFLLDWASWDWISGSKDVGELKAAMRERSATTVPVADIDDVEFSDANRVKNGDITIYAYGHKAKFVFRRKTRDQAQALFDELEQEIAQARSGPKG